MMQRHMQKHLTPCAFDLAFHDGMASKCKKFFRKLYAFFKKTGPKWACVKEKNAIVDGQNRMPPTRLR